jgi:predicted metal-binding membrane protein
MSKRWIAAVLVVVAVVVLAWAAPAWTQEKGPEGKHSAEAMHAKYAQVLQDAVDRLDAAAKALEAGQHDQAIAELKAARALVADAQKAIAGMLPKDQKVVNARCPIMGTKLDVEKVPAELTRMHKGQKVGFCCEGCPVAWDKLTDAEKDKKLQEAMGPAPEAPK